MELRQQLEEMKTSYNQRLGKLEQLKTDKSNCEQELTNIKTTLLDYECERSILQKTSENARAYATKRLEDTMTTALQHVFGMNYSASIEPDISAGKPVVEIYTVEKQGEDEIRTKPQENNGGGIVDIVSIALRIAMIQLQNDPPLNGPIILDEPGKHVSADFSIKLAEFLKFVSSHFKKQIIFVTHNDDLKSIADISYKVFKVGDTSIAQLITKEQAKEDFGNVEMPF